MGNVKYNITIRIRPIIIREALMKKTFCFMFQHAASTELKQWTEAGSRGGYMNNVKVLASSKRGQMPDDKGPQRSTQKPVQCPN